MSFRINCMSHPNIKAVSVLGLAAIHSPLTSLIKSDLSGLTFINSIPEFADSIKFSF